MCDRRLPDLFFSKSKATTRIFLNCNNMIQLYAKPELLGCEEVFKLNSSIIQNLLARSRSRLECFSTNMRNA